MLPARVVGMDGDHAWTGGNNDLTQAGHRQVWATLGQQLGRVRRPLIGTYRDKIEKAGQPYSRLSRWPRQFPILEAAPKHLFEDGSHGNPAVLQALLSLFLGVRLG